MWTIFESFAYDIKCFLEIDYPSKSLNKGRKYEIEGEKSYVIDAIPDFLEKLFMQCKITSVKILAK